MAPRSVLSLKRGGIQGGMRRNEQKSWGCGSWNFGDESPTVLVPLGKVAWKSLVLSQTTGKRKFMVSKDLF